VDKQTTGAWIVHHGRKVAADLRGAAEFSAIDLAAKAAGLLARLGESDQATLSSQQVTAAARIGNLNPKTELGACLDQLQKRKLIDRSASGAVSVLGVTGATALTHAAELFEDNEPQPTERAALNLAELSSQVPISVKGAIDFVGDVHKLTKADAADFVQQATLVAALSYGMSQSPQTRGRIWGIDWLLRKLIAGGTVGPAPAIGNDYRALELERVVETERIGSGFYMRLLKREVGVIALDVLEGRNASASALEILPSAGMRSYTPPEVARVGLRKTQSTLSKVQTRTLLSAVRGGSAL
jgi:hypothetical protein